MADSTNPSLGGHVIQSHHLWGYSKNYGGFQGYSPFHNKSSWEEGSGPKKFEDYTYTYSGPDIQPQMQINSVNPNFASAYDQALGVVKDSLNTANPLANLNL